VESAAWNGRGGVVFFFYKNVRQFSN